MIKAIAIDDEPKALQIIETLSKRVEFLSLEKTFLDPIEAIQYVNTNQIDLVLLDIQMPDINGLQLAQHFETSPLLIFTTAHSKYAAQSYELQAVDYLLKPFDFSRFLQAINRVKDRLVIPSVPDQDFFFINTGNQKQRLFWQEIQYVEGDGNYVHYHTESGKKMVRSTIKETLKNLPAKGFVRIHRSFVVALRWIEKIEDNHVFIADRKLSISASYRDAFFKAIQ